MGSNDSFQLNPHEVGEVAGDHMRSLGSRLSNYNAMTRSNRLSQDRTRSSFDCSKQLNPERAVTDEFLAHGTDWALFNYNPYGKANDITGFENPNRRRLSDHWAQIIGLGTIELEDWDIVSGDGSTGVGMLQYRNYPEEGHSSFGKKGDKRWTWRGNSWVPGV